MLWLVKLIAIFGGASAYWVIHTLKEKRSRKELERAMAKAKEALEKNRNQMDKMVKDEDEKTKRTIEEMDKIVAELQANSDIFDEDCLDIIRYRG